MTSTDNPVPLWEIQHPYYCEEGNFFKNGLIQEFSSWEDFAQPTKGLSFNDIMIEDKGNILYDFDDDYNTVWRWDWKKTDPSDYEEELKTGEIDELPSDVLLIFFMHQRKAKNSSVRILITDDDEPAVREWLTKKANYMKQLWEPFLQG